MSGLVRRRQLRQSNGETQLGADCERLSHGAPSSGQRGDALNTRYPRIREVYAGDELVCALDRVDALAYSDSLIHLVLVQYLDVLENALGDDSAQARQPGSLLHRALDAVHEALQAFGLIEVASARQLN